MIRSMMLVCAIGALGAVGCVASSDAADESAVAQNTGGGGLFDCQNKASISGVQCVGDISILNGIDVDVKNVRALDGNEISVLDGDLNNVKVQDINVLDPTVVLKDVKVTALDDFLNKFHISVSNTDVSVCALQNLVKICAP
jgi:hypothetical protein